MNCDFDQAEYIKDPMFTTREKKKILKECIEIPGAFPAACLMFKETQSHLLKCPELVSKLNYLDVKPSTLNENNIL